MHVTGPGGIFCIKRSNKRWKTSRSTDQRGQSLKMWRSRSLPRWQQLVTHGYSALETWSVLSEMSSKYKTHTRFQRLSSRKKNVRYFFIKKMLYKHYIRVSLVAQWLRIRLPVQGIRVQALLGEDPTCGGATKPERHNYWACALQPTSHNDWARVPQLLKPARLEPVLHSKRSHHSEKPAHCKEE